MRVLAFIVVASLLLVGVAAAGRADWTGSAKCGSCHPQILASWLKTPHASTAKRFPSKPESKCLACHGTGDAPAGTAIAVEVGCEACHGAGAAYGEQDIMRSLPVARALGLADLSTAANRTKLCMTCHARQTKSKFDPLAPVHPISVTKP